MLTVTNPATGKVIRELPAGNADTIAAVMERSQQAYTGWKETSFGERAEVLRKVAGYMRDNIESLAPLMTEEMGKPIKEARAEVTKAAWCADHYADHAEAYLATDTIASDASHSYVRYLPLGPVLGILPWNAPFWLAFRFCAPALMAGNTCVMKHDQHVPACAEAIADVFEKAGAPADIMQNLILKKPDVELAIRSPRIRAVSFTGSDKAGAIVASVAASEIKPAVLELGGSDPAIVLADADLEAAADAISLSRIINAGQSCIAAKRIIVEAPVYDDFVAMLRQRLEKLKLGDPADDATDVGPIARAELRDNLHRQVQETVEAGARCLLGGELPEGPGYFYPVTLLADVHPGMTAACEETFGPVAVVMKVGSEAEALALANDTDYGLAASIWTKTERGEALSLKMEAGQVVVNGVVKTDPRLPSGGIKRSGYGRELGPHGIHAFVNAQQVWVGPKQE
ncbi:MAG TPA: succinate-semialdehyde dehydrogenase [Spongiibacteraceae bacterium]|nr:succinate-semialdehyde dehydrogenase [Spongiibacteraceae bacterium]HCS29416.1 succinate-semialdehyde dehydrogenase [Spongiibacteraceae bacterium]|tara:strand:+ start:801 stop:2171 length:1371 start_codon:yes stop_codon:yes gene_type:complete